MKETPELIAIVGPTASGKSALAVEAALEFGGEVISADSRQVYRGMNIGTGKIAEEEMCGVPHHLLDVADPNEIYTVAHFKEAAEQQIREIQSRGKLPILCGGTGLYLDAVLYNLQIPEVPPNAELRKELQQLSTEKLFERLQNVDPRRASEIDRNNPVRLIRAIEIAETLGLVPSLPPRELAYDAVIIGITPPDDLPEKIERRLDQRLAAGMIEEVSQLHNNGVSFERLESLGLEYYWVAQFLQNKVSREEMREKLLRNIIAYSKRQMTWFRKNKDIRWAKTDEALGIISDALRSFGQLPPHQDRRHQ